VEIYPAVEGAALAAFGHSYLDPTFRANGIGPAQRYIDRVNHRLGTVLDNNGVGGYHMHDAALDAIGINRPSGQAVLNERGIAVIDCITNDAILGVGPQLTDWETSFRALCAWLAVDSANLYDNTWPGYAYSAGWSAGSFADASSGDFMQVPTSSMQAAITWGHNIPGRWALMFLATSINSGRDMEILVDGSVVKSFNTKQAVMCTHMMGTTRRQWAPMVQIIDIPPGQHTVAVQTKAGGVSTDTVFFDGMFRLNVIDPVQIFVPKGVYLADGSLDATFDAYNARLAAVAAEFGNVHVIDTLTGWDRNTMIGADRVHPSVYGHEVLADRVTAAILDFYGS
jgi:hypothetical protein